MYQLRRENTVIKNGLKNVLLDLKPIEKDDFGVY